MYSPDPAIDSALFALSKAKERVEHMGEPETDAAETGVIEAKSTPDEAGGDSTSVSINVAAKAPEVIPWLPGSPNTSNDRGSAQQLQASVDQNPRDAYSLFYLALDYDQESAWRGTETRRRN